MNINSNQLKLLQNAEWLYEKQQILLNIEKLLWKIADNIKNRAGESLEFMPEKTDIKSGKLSRGENLNRLPYRILDFPRLFSNDQFFAFRYLFWWGNHFECTFISDDTAINKHIIKALQTMDISNLYCFHGKGILKMDISDKSAHFKLFSETNFEEKAPTTLRLSCFYDLSEWSKIPEEGYQFYKLIADAYGKN
ncbi:MAG: hypothetical protein EA412_11635 [Chitinophagaceae bacterium]|nr:MAG: hypothetical protein EA412_11635 [Chitinophagaceae bacterium]